jgi:hypothetical protein
MGRDCGIEQYEKELLKLFVCEGCRDVKIVSGL